MQAVDIELMIKEGLIKRFGNSISVNGQLQFLNDNGPEFIEKILKKSLRSRNIDDCSTPTNSPQSNRRRESLNGTFKRDYMCENSLGKAHIVLKQIPKWKESNNFAPHIALEMKTPNKVYNLKNAA